MENLNDLPVSVSTKKVKLAFKCSFCFVVFANGASLVDHLKSHNVVGKGIEEEGNRGENSKNLVKEDKKKLYGCSECPKEFRKRSNLQVHFRRHTGEEPFACSHCSRKFITSSNLKRHIRGVHIKEKSFKCGQCDCCFSQSSHLKGHMRIHAGQKPYVCKYCSRCFSQSSNLTTHVKIHTGEKLDKTL